MKLGTYPRNAKVCNATDDVSRDDGLGSGSEGFDEEAGIHDDETEIGQDMNDAEENGLIVSKVPERCRLGMLLPHGSSL
jgi:hypothetical protein